MLFDPPDAWFGNQTLMAIWLIAALLLVHLGYSGVSISYHAPRRGAHRRLQRAHQGHGRPRGVRPARHDRSPSCCRPALTAKFGDCQGYMMLGLLFLPILVLFSLPTLDLGRAVGPSAGHPRRAQRLHRLLRAAEEPPVPPPAAGLRRQRRGAGRRRDGDAVLCRARAEGQQAAGRHHPARLLHRRRRQRADVADAVEAARARPPPGSSAWS